MPNQDNTNPIEMDTEDGGGSSNTRQNPTQRSDVKKEMKRKVYNRDGEEIADVKRNRPKPVEGEKELAYMTVLHWTAWSIHHFELKETIYNIDTMNELASIMSTIHHILRQEANAAGGMAAKITATHEFKINGKSLLRSFVAPSLKAIAALYGFNYGTTEKDRKLMGTLAAILSLLVAFKSRLAEVRTSVLELKFGKEGDVTKVRRIDQYILEDCHSLLMSGANMTPQLKSSQKACLGPIAIALQLAFTMEKKYQKTWKECFIQAFKLFPNVNEMAELIAGSKFDQSVLIRELADIALFGTTRTSNKMYPPLAMFYAAASKNSVGAMINIPMVRMEKAWLDPSILHLDFSGRGAYHFWNSCVDLPFSMKKGKMTIRTMKEVHLHATFGTHKEDLSLVHYMTGHDFQTRKEIGEQFSERGSVGMRSLKCV